MAAVGAPLRAIQEWMGHTDARTTAIYADYAPDTSLGAIWAARAFSAAPAHEPAVELAPALAQRAAAAAPRAHA